MDYSVHVGDVFGKWTVIKEEEFINKRHKCLCRCSCENHTERYVEKYNLLNGNSLSCGCISKETNKELFSTHGKSNTRLYKVWRSMKQRCYDPNNHAYQNYGGRGISVCDEWVNDFEAFEQWAFQSGYDSTASKGQYTLERKDVYKGYSPLNCYWKTLREQSNNRTNTIWLTYNGKTQTLVDWAAELNISPKTLRNRYRKGWEVSRILSDSLERKQKILIEYNGETHSPEQWSRILDIPTRTICGRLKRGCTTEEILSQAPLGRKSKKGE